MSFRITGLPLTPFQHLFGQPDDSLAKHNAIRLMTDEASDFADRIELRKPDPGETVLLINYVHQPANSPYQASHAIHVSERATTPYHAIDEIPDVMRDTVLSLRGFDEAGMLIQRSLTEGGAVMIDINEMFRTEAVAYIHAHYAGAGCYAARLDRA